MIERRKYAPRHKVNTNEQNLSEEAIEILLNLFHQRKKTLSHMTANNRETED